MAKHNTPQQEIAHFNVYPESQTPKSNHTFQPVFPNIDSSETTLSALAFAGFQFLKELWVSLAKLLWVILIISRKVEKHFMLARIWEMFLFNWKYSILSYQIVAANLPPVRVTYTPIRGFNHFPKLVWWAPAPPHPMYNVEGSTYAWGRDSLTLWKVCGSMYLFCGGLEKVM